MESPRRNLSVAGKRYFHRLVIFYFGHKFTASKNDLWIIPSEEMDLYTGLDEVLASETPAPLLEKWYMKWKAVY